MAAVAVIALIYFSSRPQNLFLIFSIFSIFRLFRSLNGPEEFLSDPEDASREISWESFQNFPNFFQNFEKLEEDEDEEDEEDE